MHAVALCMIIYWHDETAAALSHAPQLGTLHALKRSILIREARNAHRHYYPSRRPHQRLLLMRKLLQHLHITDS